jgi:hypothetical protein
VDFVAGAICGIADEPDTVGGVFHLANPDPPPASEVFDWLEDMGYEIERLPYPEWLEVQREARKADDVIGGILHGTTPGEHEIRDDNTYDDRNTRRVLEGSGLRRPEIGPDLLENCARYFAEQGWIEAPPALSGGRRTST